MKNLSFKEIKNLLTKPFEIWYTFEIDGEWFINFLLYDGELLWSYQTDDINDLYYHWMNFPMIMMMKEVKY